MRIGLTYDLRQEYLAAGFSEEETAEFDRPDTIEAIDEAVQFLGHETDRIGNVRQLVARLARGDRWDLVVNIAEGLHGLAREAQVPALLDAYQIPYTFSDALVTAVCLHKGLTKMVVRHAGVPTPDFAVIERLEDLDRVALPYPLFAKPVAEGTGKGIDGSSKITDPDALRSVCAELLRRFRQPVLVETFLPGREMTVGIWGTGPEAEVIGTMEILLRPTAEPEVYSYLNKEQCDDRVDYRVFAADGDDEVRRAEQVALAAWRALGCRDAGRVDVRSDARGQPHFIEVNPLAGLHPQHSDLPMICTGRGIPYARLIERIVESALRRAGETAR
ncbi:MAG: D-alanine--D-alanine ligase [Thermoguttaceae bacterium]|jgi:D-alanine-D-alanine ligase|nr:D-alanine--D-alanine ligase [Thermoguttaceae bacterium]